MSVTVKERERDREWDSRSFHEDRPRGSVTIRRYKVPDRDEDDRLETSSRYSRRDNLASPRHSEFRDSSNVREFRYERDVENDRPRDRDLYEYRSERARSPPRDDYREIRIEREISRDPPRRERDRDSYEIDHYTKTTDYYAREPQPTPQPIYIRNDAPAPIIIREQAPQPVIIREERPRSPRSEIVREREREQEERRTEVSRRTEIDHKSEVNEERTLVKRDPSPQPQEDEYYYQRTTREIARRDRDDYDDYKSQRDAHQRDSVSQYNRGRRNESEDYYYRREEIDTGERARSKSRHRLHVAEGAIAGLAAGGLLNRHRKHEGERSGGLKNLAGGAIVGAAATEIASRARSRFRGSRSRSGSRDRSWGRGRRHRDRSRSGSRSRSHSKEGFWKETWNNTGNLGKLGAVAAVGALAGYAVSRRGKIKEAVDERRSRSRVRRESRSLSRSISADSARSKKHRNSTIAKAGLASAAVAGVVDRVRSRSRGGRSKSRIRTGAPIAAAGIGGAALAGLYERHKAKKEEREIAEGHRGVSHSRSRSRSRSAAPAQHSRERHSGERNLIEYGDDPIGPADQYERSRGDDYYGEYANRRRHSRSSSGSASPRRRRYDSRSRSRDRIAETAAGAGIAGVAAHEASQRRDRKRAERQRRYEEEQGAPGQAAPGASYGFGPYGQEAPPAPAPPPPQGDFAPPPNEPYYPPEGYAPPNAYSPMPQFLNSGPPPNNFNNQQSYAPPPQGSGPPAQGGYGYQPPGGGQYPPQNVSIDSNGPEQARADDLNEHEGREEEEPASLLLRRTSRPERTQSEEPQADSRRGRHSAKSVMFDLRPSSENPHHSPSLARSAAMESSGDFDGVDLQRESEDGHRDEFPSLRHREQGARFGDAPDQSDGGDDRAGYGADERARRGGDDRRRHGSDDRSFRGVEGRQGADRSTRRGHDSPENTSREMRSSPSRQRQHNGNNRSRANTWDQADLHQMNRARAEERRQSGRRPQGRRSEQEQPGDESDDSGETISLPDRFDSEGRKKAEPGDDPLADQVQEWLHGRGRGGQFLRRFATDLLGGGRRRAQTS